MPHVKECTSRALAGEHEAWQPFRKGEWKGKGYTKIPHIFCDVFLYFFFCCLNMCLFVTSHILLIDLLYSTVI